MEILDAQVHVTQEGCGKELAVMDALGISATILDEFWGYDEANRTLPFALLDNGAFRPLSPNAQCAALLHPARFAWVQRIERRDTQLPALFAILSTSPGCVGVRIDLRGDGELGQLADGGWDELLGLAARYALPVSLLSRKGAASIARVAARLPDVRFLIDHCGHAASEDEWKDILALGKFHNVWLKWAQAPLVFKDDAPPFPKSQANLVRAADSFGVEHIVWASNASVTRKVATISQLLDSMRSAAGFSAGDLEWLLGRSARKLYDWQPLNRTDP